MRLARVPGLVALAALVAALVGGCGGARDEPGTAWLWVTRDRGAEVLVERRVSAGQTVLDALREHAEVETRYGGRFVRSVDGIEGSLAGRRDWFWFVNGIEGDRSAAEYRLRVGDVAWWDFRSWGRRMSEPVVVGSFPEPFLHGYDGRRRPAAVRYEPGLAAAARAIATVIQARSVAPSARPASPEANVFRLVRGRPRFEARLRAGGGAGSPVEFVFAGDAFRLARRPELVRFRYRGLP